MSYEGYFQVICKSGHISGADCYDTPNFDGPERTTIYQGIDTGEEFDSPLWRCLECNEVAAWWNSVDTTNGSYYENKRIDGYVELELATEPDICVCECGYIHHKNGEHSTYHIPEEGGHIVNGGSNTNK